MPNDRLTQAAWIIVACTAIAACGFLMGPISRERLAIHPNLDPRWKQSVSPDVAIAMAALGPFRGLGVDYLWYRAVTLQQEGKYFEANQLSRWITTLQPRSPQVGAFHAWNMAYNISVATHTADERWDWVSKGISLLRDRGIVHNPTATRLYRELAWIYFHKIGQFSDDMHWHYKRMLAQRWHDLLGNPGTGGSTQEAIEHIRQIAEAADSLELLTRDHPESAAMMTRLTRLGYRSPALLLLQIGRAMQLTGDEPQNEDTEQDPDTGPGPGPRLVQAVKTADAKTLDPLLAYLRKRILREDYHMDPAFMLHLMEVYGPIDWRHPAAHGCYWSEMGVKMAEKRDDPGAIDLLNTNRQSIHSLQQLAWFGRVHFDRASGQYDLLPDPRFIPAYDRAMDLARERIARGEFGPAASDNFAKGHENFLLRAMTDHYLYGDADEARHFYDKVRRLYRRNSPNDNTQRYRKPLVELVSEELSQQLDTRAVAGQFLIATLGRAFDHGLAENRMDVFNRFVLVARAIHTKFQEGKTPRGTTTQARVGLLPFNEAVAEALVYYMQSANIPLIKKVRVWANAPPALTSRVYEQLRPILHASAEENGLDPDRAFPDPIGAGRTRILRIEPATDDELKSQKPSPEEPAASIERK